MVYGENGKGLSDSWAGDPVDLTIEYVQSRLGSYDGRLPIYLAVSRAIDVVRRIADEKAAADSAFSRDTYFAAVSALEEATQPISQALAWLVTWGQRGIHERVILQALRKLANIADKHTGNATWISLRRWPAVLSLAAVGVAAVDSEREDLLGLVLSRVKVRHPNGDLTALAALVPGEAIESAAAATILGAGNKHTPVDDLVADRLVGWITPDPVDSEAQFIECFDRYQFLVWLAYWDARSSAGRGGWAAPGAFGWRRQYGWDVPDAIASEVEVQKGSWPYLSGGLFGGDPGRVQSALKAFEEFRNRLPMSWR